ncbi:MAG: hypothetical protein IJ676_02490 [Clostridia bacterium]|nr:hypothetical protein [Clostridia bacterium]
MIDVLYKKARGYDVEESTKEYVVDEEGNKRLVKEKTSVKHIPPDLTALKAYMEVRDTELTSMSNEELKKEKERLLAELKENEEKEKKK